MTDQNHEPAPPLIPIPVPPRDTASADVVRAESAGIGPPSEATSSSPATGQQNGPTAESASSTAEKPPTPTHPATTWQTIWCAVFVILTTVVIGWPWFCEFGRLENLLQKETVVSWKGFETTALKPGPASFIYDRETGSLRCRGAIDSKLKMELIALLEVPDSDKADNSKLHGAEISSYSDAISQLAYQSNAQVTSIFFVLLTIGGLSGALGVQLRSMVNFVGVVCYKNELDLFRWWPWYALRPVIGFSLGVLIVILAKSELFTAGDKSSTGSVWWVSIAFLAGFGASEFTERLRLLTQTLFGKSERDKKVD